jgi:hypothetical protein
MEWSTMKSGSSHLDGSGTLAGLLREPERCMQRSRFTIERRAQLFDLKH